MPLCSPHLGPQLEIAVKQGKVNYQVCFITENPDGHPCSWQILPAGIKVKMQAKASLSGGTPALEEKAEMGATPKVEVK